MLDRLTHSLILCIWVALLNGNPEWLGANSGVKLNVIYYRMPVTPIIPGTSLHASNSSGY